VHLLLDLFQRLLRAIDPQRYARDFGSLGRAYREALDVETASYEEPRDAHEHAGLVLNVN
jgi:hypothetical protein